MFVGVDNDLPAALPLASPRLKILMTPHWCCRVTGRLLGGSVSWEVTRGVGILGKLAKVQGVLVKSYMKI